MGTNFYLDPKPRCKECGRSHEAKHIGKSSAGWVFSLRIYPEGPRNLEEWIAKFYEPGAVIKDEYDRTIPPAEMIANIAGRAGHAGAWTDIALRQNGATRGPNNLARASGDSSRAGPGTWDYCEYEFS